jgi:DNA invertase Pin-like site-specific DNA recombinase
MIDAALERPSPFDVIVVHSFSRFFRDQFQFEFYLRKLAKNGVQLVSITQILGDDPMSEMMRKIMTLFDEYQSKENGKHTLRAMNENARQGFWNGARPPIGYRAVAAEQRGAKIKKSWRSIRSTPKRCAAFSGWRWKARMGAGRSGSWRSRAGSMRIISARAMAVGGARAWSIRC